MPKCYVCGSDKIVKVFTPKRNLKVKHYYCESCAKKYLKKVKPKK